MRKTDTRATTTARRGRRIERDQIVGDPRLQQHHSICTWTLLPPALDDAPTELDPPGRASQDCTRRSRGGLWRRGADQVEAPRVFGRRAHARGTRAWSRHGASGSHRTIDIVVGTTRYVSAPRRLRAWCSTTFADAVEAPHDHEIRPFAT